MTTTAPHRAIYRRWRAQTFAQIVGQEATVTSLRNAVRSGRLAHGLLFVGPRGTGKTSTARIVAKAVNCASPAEGEPCDACDPCVEIREGRALDVIELDAASNRGIDDIREIREGLVYPPTSLRRKVYILDEAHQVTRDAWGAFLKTLEEPPEYALFIFASTNPAQFPPAVLSRLQRFDFTRLTRDEIAGKMRAILADDGRGADDDAIDLIARLADGGMRDAESMLDQLLSSGTDRLTADRVREMLGLAPEESVERFLASLVDGDPLPGIVVLDALDERGRDLRAFVDQCVDALRLAIVASLGPAAARAETPLGDRPRDALASAARRLVGVDPARVGRGGIRFELELALLAAGEGGSPAPAVSPAAAPTAPAPPAPSRATTTAPPAPPARRQTAPTQGAPAAPTQAAPPARPSAAPAPAAPAPAASAPAPGSDPVGGLDLDAVLAAWPRIVAAVGENPASKPLITSCAPIAVDGNTVTIAFPEAQAFLRERAEKRRAEIERGFDHALGGRVVVRFVASNVVPAPPPSEDRDDDRILAEARRIFADDIAGVADID